MQSSPRRARRAPSSATRVVLRPAEDRLERVLRELQFVMLKHPVAAQALFRTFVAEGRRFARTDTGARLRRRIERSELIRRGRVVWEVGTLNMLEEAPSSALPSKFLDAILMAATTEGIEPLLSKLFERGLDDADGRGSSTER